MAPHRQAKQAAAESTVSAADGNVTPPKKRKTTAKSSATNEPKQTKSRASVRQAKANKRENEQENGEPASPPKKSRGRQKNAANTATTAVKSDTKSRSRKQVNKEPDNAAQNDQVGEEVTEKRTRTGRTAATVKKGTKDAVKPKAKAPAVRKPKAQAADKNDVGDSEKKNATVDSRTTRITRRMKAIEESNMPTQSPPKVSRKRKNVVNADEAVTDVQTSKEEEEKNKNKAKVTSTSKKPRDRTKKAETDDAPVPSKGKSKKNPTKEAKPLPEEAEIETQNNMEQNIAVQNNPKSKSMKNTKKAAPKRKLYTAAENTNEPEVEETVAEEAVAEDATPPEMDLIENGEAHVAELKQKKKNEKANVANGKVEVKGKQKKGQAAATSVDEKEETNDVPAERETIEMKVVSETDENNAKDVSLNKDDSGLLTDEDIQIKVNNSINENETLLCS